MGFCFYPLSSLPHSALPLMLFTLVVLLRGPSISLLPHILSQKQGRHPDRPETPNKTPDVAQSHPATRARGLPGGGRLAGLRPRTH